MSAYDDYFDRLTDHLQRLRTTSRAAIEECAEVCVESLLSGGAIHVFDTGHLVSRELINRAGGLAAFLPFNVTLTVDNPHPGRTAEKDVRGDAPGTSELVAAAFSRSSVRAGDVMIVGSVSGNSPMPVEVCLHAGRKGLKTIALTAVAYSSRLESRHPSEKRLFEAADHTIDNGAPFGDAMMRMAGLEEEFGPFSGIGAVVSLWALGAEICERMVARGMPPTVFASINRSDGPERYEKAKKRFLDKGY
jgi:uncharacterized phosphosugar-binding protein